MPWENSIGMVDCKQGDSTGTFTVIEESDSSMLHHRTIRLLSLDAFPTDDQAVVEWRVHGVHM